MAFEFGRLSRKLKISVDQDGRLVKQYDDTYLVLSDAATAPTNDAACAAVGILPGAPHPDWAAATCDSIDCERNPTLPPHCSWNISYHYSTNAVVPENTTDPDPVLRRVKRRTATTEQQHFIVKDKNGDLIVDSAGSPPDGGVPVTDFFGSYTWERDEAHTSTSMQQAAAYSGRTNSTTFMGCAAGTLMLKVTGEEKWEGSYHYWTFTYQMDYDPDGWDPQPVNAGLYELVAGTRKRIMVEGKPVQEPQPLDAAGAEIPVASRPGACIFIDVDHRTSFDFATLGLPTT